ncbi:MAG: outer membrane lipoprotein carrier protein LolA [Desulfobacteraceae bacterium]|nr:MAG: outer membrane lipoprotein carrier protein LolA [Desulfobacteraceae bacterium]
MKFRVVLFCIAAVFCQICSGTDAKGTESSLTADEIITKVENRYSVPGFTARFIQESTLKAMDITDVAAGKIFVKRPGMMRWEYEKPEKQLVITDGENLWIYRPDINQVMAGKAPEFFGTGKGASFLSDIRIVRRNFSVSLKKNKEDYFILRLLPKEKRADLAEVFLSVSKRSFEISRIGIYNAYGDETVIDLLDSKFVDSPGSIFTFKIPEGAEIIRIGE